jgi:Leucine-rich repeat (LRR) protein
MSLSLSLTRRLQLWNMGLTEVPSEVFRMKNLKTLMLGSSNLCALPSDIAQLTTLETLGVRLSKRSCAI